MRDAMPMRMSAFAEMLAKHLPADAIIFDEALTNSPELTRWLHAETPGALLPDARRHAWASAFPARSASSSPIPTARSSASPATAARCTPTRRCGPRRTTGIGAKFVVCNNSSYRLLKENLVDTGATSAARASGRVPAALRRARAVGTSWPSPAPGRAGAAGHQARRSSPRCARCSSTTARPARSRARPRRVLKGGR